MKNIDVGKKKDTERKATAIGRLFTTPEVIKLIKEGKIEKITYIDLYRKSGGGFFRNKSHLHTYLERQELLKK